jgi:hypothetical protein
MTNEERRSVIDKKATEFVELLTRLNIGCGNTSWPREIEIAHDRIKEAALWAKSYFCG